MLIMINTKFIYFIDVKVDDTLYVPHTETHHFITKKNISTSKFSNNIRVNNYIASKFSNGLRLFLHFQICFLNFNLEFHLFKYTYSALIKQPMNIISHIQRLSKGAFLV